jgi:hypothetical protein
MARERTIILDDDEPPAAKRPAEARETPRFGFEWGLASTAIAAILLLASPMVLLFCLFYWSASRSDHLLGYSGVKMANGAGIVICTGALIFGILGLLFGIRGLGRARQAHQPAALPVTGILLSLAALIMWIIIAIDWVMIMDSTTGASSYY